MVFIGRPARFATLYTLGNFAGVLGSFFLAGPAAQCRNMKKKDRALTSFVFLISMVLTFITVELNFRGRALAILLLVIVQWAALVWYTLSYIPYGRKIAKKVLKKCAACCCDL